MLRKRFPIIFQGNLKKKSYFEGWYFKIVDKSYRTIYAIIPGIALDKKGGTSHAFIQILNGITADYHYLQFPLSEFESSKDKFFIKIGTNRFSQTQITLDISREEIDMRGTLSFQDIVEFPRAFLRPNIMGPFTFLPFLQCYHGLVSLSSKIEGKLLINGESIDFSEGRNYIEKDYGISFPKHWVWMQSNHFQNESITLFFSIAEIPYLGLKFTGFLCTFTFEEDTIIFSPYSSAKITYLHISKKSVEIKLENHKYILKILAKKAPTNPNGPDSIIQNENAVMRAPKKGLMIGKCIESMTASLQVELYQKTRKHLFGLKKLIPILKDTGKFAGLEIMAQDQSFPKITKKKKGLIF